MIVTLTPNPSVDRAFDLAALEVGEVNRASAVHVDAGGKGLNVSRALAANGVASLAVLPLGGSDGDLLIRLLEPTGVAIRAVRVPGETRSNVTLQAASGVTTKVNAPGPVLDTAAVAELFAAVAEAAGPGDVVVAAGSLPCGSTEGCVAGLGEVDHPYAGLGEVDDLYADLGEVNNLYATLGEVVRARGAWLVLDSSGPAFATAVAAGGLALVKPNDEELGQSSGARCPRSATWSVRHARSSPPGPTASWSASAPTARCSSPGPTRGGRVVRRSFPPRPSGPVMRRSPGSSPPAAARWRAPTTPSASAPPSPGAERRSCSPAPQSPPPTSSTSERSGSCAIRTPQQPSWGCDRVRAPQQHRTSARPHHPRPPSR